MLWEGLKISKPLPLFQGIAPEIARWATGGGGNGEGTLQL